MLPERLLEALSLTISRAEQQVKGTVLLDRNSGFINADALVIKMTVRVLKETEAREYSMCKQVVVHAICIYLYTSSCRSLLDLPAYFSRCLLAARFLHKGECFGSGKMAVCTEYLLIFHSCRTPSFHQPPTIPPTRFNHKHSHRRNYGFTTQRWRQGMWG